MDHRLDRLARTIVSRRTALVGLTALGLRLLRPGESSAHNPRPRCQRISNAKRRRACIRRARAHTKRHHRRRQQRRPAPRQPDAFCEAPTIGIYDLVPGERLAQTFTATNSGSLTAVALEVFQTQLGPGLGDYLVAIHTVDPDSGFPTNNAIASTVLARSLVPRAVAPVQIPFSTPAQVQAGRQYAIVVAQPTGTGKFAVLFGNGCPGGAMFYSGSATEAFRFPDGFSYDVAYFATTVSP